MIRRLFALIFGIILGAVAICGIWCYVAPREFFQTIMSDEAYATFTITHNAARVTKSLAKAATSKSAYTYKADMNVNLDKSAVLNSEDAASALSNYLSASFADGKINFQKDGFKATLNLFDGKNEILSGEGIVSGSRQCFKLRQLGDQWFERSHKGIKFEDGKLNIFEQFGAVKKLKKSDFADKVKISVVDEDKTIAVGDVTTSGEVITMITNAEDFKTMLSAFSEKAEAQSSAEKFTAFLEKNNVEQVVINLFVDKRNHIVGISLGFATPEESKATVIMAVKSEDIDNKYAVEYDNDKFFSTTVLTFEEAPYESYTVPSTTETIPVDEASLKQELQDFLIKNLASGHPELEKFYSALLNKVIGEKVDSFISTITGDSEAGQNAGELIGEFFSLFGIGG
ncbi:MAG: hypothetical protein IK036_03240 [Clostridia bacterium]|nr:hypothetical protein [Clostridia bacterium]MBR5991749.1 hypothetical protein [Clostridia bacterium]